MGVLNPYHLLRTFEFWVLTVIDFPKLRVLKGSDSNRFPNITGAKAPVAPMLNTPLPNVHTTPLEKEKIILEF